MKFSVWKKKVIKGHLRSKSQLCGPWVNHMEYSISIPINKDTLYSGFLCLHTQTADSASVIVNTLNWDDINGIDVAGAKKLWSLLTLPFFLYLWKMQTCTVSLNIPKRNSLFYSLARLLWGALTVHNIVTRSHNSVIL